ncbi:hypothetical protein TIFTF001_012391 [Ficus carica]|uniref:Uncharacterized protein n=1 Tax=Ficus carica TaxID=3494 RepID=A0AA88A2A1_FICCA|nr:hypothetical protein TIFTF001_012391 [Ficus carica]
MKGGDGGLAGDGRMRKKGSGRVRSFEFGDRGKALVSSLLEAVFDCARLSLFVVVSWETDVR